MLGETLIGIAILLGVLWVYFIPTYVARRNHHHNQHAIFLVNLLLGWTFLGWVGALVWASTNPPPSRVSHRRETGFEYELKEDELDTEWGSPRGKNRPTPREDYAFDEDGPTVRSLPPYLLKEKRK